MSPLKLSAFIDLLRNCQLVGPEHLSEVHRRLLPRHSDARTLAKDLVQHGWLTVFQANQLLLNRGHELVLGPCRLLDRLGEGAISQVYKAWHTERNEVTAVKVLRPEFVRNDEAVRQFEREIQATTRLAHPNIVTALEVGQDGPRRYLVMEYIEGTDLEKFVQLSGPLPAGHACDYVQQAALGLQHAHERGLVHRDIKPANLFVTAPAGLPPPAVDEHGQLRLVERAIIKVLDWGLARLEAPRYEERNTSAWIQPGALVGTADYMAPEQARNPRGVDIRADLYSLGCTFFFLLTGQPPFPGKSLMQKLLQHEEAEPPSVESLRPDIPRTLAPLLRKLLAKKPEDRPHIPLSVAVALAPFCRTNRTPAEHRPRPATAASAHLR